MREVLWLGILVSSSHGFVGQFRPPLQRKINFNNILLRSPLLLYSSKKWKHIDFSNLDELPDELKNELGVSNHEESDEYDGTYDEDDYMYEDEDGSEDDDNESSESLEDEGKKSEMPNEFIEKGEGYSTSNKESSSMAKNKQQGHLDAEIDSTDSEYEYYDEYEYYQTEDDAENIIEEKKREITNKEKLQKSRKPDSFERGVIAHSGTMKQTVTQNYSNPKPQPRHFDYLNLGVGDDFIKLNDDTHEAIDYDENEEDEDDAVYPAADAGGADIILDELNINESEMGDIEQYDTDHDDFETLESLEETFDRKEYDPSELSNEDYSEMDEEEMREAVAVGAIEEERENNKKWKANKHQEAKVKNVWRKLQQWGSPKRSSSTVDEDDPLNLLGFESDRQEEVHIKPLKNAEYYFQKAKEGHVDSGQDVKNVEAEENLMEFGEFGEWKIKPQEARTLSLDADTPPPAAFRVKQVCIDIYLITQSHHFFITENCLFLEIT